MIIKKSPSEIQKMRVANVLVAEVLNELRRVVQPGVATEELDILAEERVRAAGAIPAFKGYHGFPSTLCTSINDEVVHGIPSGRVLQSGDVVSIDLGVVVDGFYGDSAVTLAVGSISAEAEALLGVTQESLNRSISKAQPGGYVSDLGHAVQQYVESHGYSVVREFVGHGIGTNLHEEPQIPNYGVPGQGVRLTEGMVLAIEPMVNVGGASVKVLDDGWTAVTQDGSLSAHFEHTIAITNDGPLVLSQLSDCNVTNDRATLKDDQRLVSVDGA